MSPPNPHHSVYYSQPPGQPGPPLSSTPLQARSASRTTPAPSQMTQLPPPNMLYEQSQGMGYPSFAPTYNAVAGPSRDSYAYGVPRAAPTPDMHHAQHGAQQQQHQQQQQQQAWSSVHPTGKRVVSQGAPAAPTVRLEDLVSSEAVRSGSAAPPGGLTSVPLNMAQPASSYDGRGAQSENGTATQQGPSEFIKKLYKMLEDENTAYGRAKAGVGARAKGERGSVGWGRGGTSFVVWDMNDFTTKVLPQTFRHSNFSSFVRQLNKYGFSKIKHVDEDTGVIRENVWEFQHPNFQAGGKSDLESIKRKAVATKKGGPIGGNGGGGGGGDERDTSPAREDAGRLMDLETRMAGMMDHMQRTHQQLQEQLRDSRGREAALVSLMRDLINHVAATERETISSPHPDERPSPRVAHLLQSLNHVTAGHPYPFPYPAPQPTMASTFVSPRTAPSSRGSKDGGIGSARPSPTHARHMAGPAAAAAEETMSLPPLAPVSMASTAARLPAPVPIQNSMVPEPVNVTADDGAPQPTLFNGEPLAMTPFDPGWLGSDAAAAQNPALWPRKSSEGATLRMMVEALSAQPPYAETPAQDSVDGSPGDVAPVDAHDDAAAAAETAKANGAANGNGTAAGAGNGAATALAPPHKKSKGMFARPSWHHAPRVLVVEDDAVTRRIAAKFLTSSGCIVETVENGQAAVDKVTTTAYDLVLMDIFLDPSMDGTQATSMIRGFGNWTPIISMTTNNSEQDITKYRKSGMTDFLAKPLSKENIFSMLEKHLRHLKAIALSGEIPRPVGIPPLNNTGVHDAIISSVPQYVADPDARNPLAGIGYPDDQYHIMMQNLLANSATFDPNSAAFQDAIGTNLVFGATAGFYAPATGQSGTFGMVGANGAGAIGLGGGGALTGAGAGAATGVGVGALLGAADDVAALATGLDMDAALGIGTDDSKRGIEAVDDAYGGSPREKKPRVGE
ncbi:kinase-regulated stress-responsive transcription factor skn7 [Cryptotrichosporon argae]